MFSNDPYVHQLYQMLLGDNVHWQDREAWIYSKGVYTRYPFQGSLYGLPAECHQGMHRGRDRSALRIAQESRGERGKRRNEWQRSLPTAEPVTDCCADGILESTAAHGPARGRPPPPRNFEEFIYKVWGAGIAKHFAIPYNRKLWAVPLTEMETSWLGGRVPLPDLEEMIEGALHPVPKPMGPNARFGYPLRGGFQALMDGCLPHLKGELRLNTAVVAVSPKRHTITLSDGSTLPYEYLISTMPLPVLIRLMGDEAAPEVRAAARQLRMSRCAASPGRRPGESHREALDLLPRGHGLPPHFRAGQRQPALQSAGRLRAYLRDHILAAQAAALRGRRADPALHRGLPQSRDLQAERRSLGAMQRDLPYAYVVYDHARPANVKTIAEWLAEQGIILAGRYSEWEYYNSDHAFLAGKKAAAQVRELERQRAAPSSVAALYAGANFILDRQ